jgi:hypothetical protein
VGVEQRLMEVTPAALDVFGAAGDWRRAQGCDGTGAISASVAAAQLAARKLVSEQTSTMHGSAAAGAATGKGRGSHGEMSELLEGMEEVRLGKDNRSAGPAGAPTQPQGPVPVSSTGGTGTISCSEQVSDDKQAEQNARSSDGALSGMDKELVLKLAQNEGEGKAAALRLSLWDYGGQKVHSRTCTSMSMHTRAS